jgi:hypothetical protein
MKKWTIYTAILLLTAACTLDETPAIDKPTRNSDGVPKVTLNITFPTPESPITRAITAEEENQIDHLYILVFHEANGSTSLLDDTYAYALQATPSGSGVDAAITDSVGGSSIAGNIKKVQLSFETAPGKKQRFVLLANLPDNLKTVIAGLSGGETEQAIIEQLKFNAKGSWNKAQDSSAGNFTPFPMFGHTSDTYTIDYDHRDQIPSSIDINLIRSLAKINVKVADDAAGYGTVFTIKNVYVCDVRTTGYVAPHSDYLDTTQPDSIGKSNLTTGTKEDFFFAFPSGKVLSNTIYVPESDSLVGTTTSPTTRPACLVIEATYNGTDYFYRIDFTRDGQFIPLLRNNSYNIKIIDIKAKGYTSLTLAKDAPLMTLNVSVLIEGGDNINDISVFNNGQYMLGLNTNEVVFDWQGNWIGRKSGDDEYHTLKVLSTYGNGDWSASVTSGNDFITATKSSTTELQINTVSTTNKVNYTGEERTATIQIKAGLLTKEITVRQTGGANSYVIGIPGVTNKTVRIPLAFVKKARNQNNIFDGKSAADFKARVIWQEKGAKVGFRAKLIGSGAITDQHYIEVTATDSAGSTKYSNAVVALTWKNPGGVGMVGGEEPDQIVWSWHVWSMPEEDTYTYGGYVNTGYHDPNQSLLMKRALGAKPVALPGGEYGLYYQWGRKDPFMYDVSQGGVYTQEKADTLINFYNMDKSEITAKQITLPTPLLPTTFISGNYPDWMFEPGDNLWDSPTGTKTYYDPCPEGWRVPVQDLSPWKNDAVSYLNDARNEFLKGHIDYQSGGFWSNTTVGLLWTASTTNNDDTYFVSITTTTLPPAIGTTSIRSSGYSVRCVKDLKRKF